MSICRRRRQLRWSNKSFVLPLMAKDRKLQWRCAENKVVVLETRYQDSNDSQGGERADHNVGEVNPSADHRPILLTPTSNQYDSNPYPFATILLPLLLIILLVFLTPILPPLISPPKEHPLHPLPLHLLLHTVQTEHIHFPVMNHTSSTISYVSHLTES